MTPFDEYILITIRHAEDEIFAMSKMDYIQVERNIEANYEVFR